MEKLTIDCKGLPCPQPVLKTRDALGEIATGQVEVVVDNEASRNNVERFARSQGHEASLRELADGCWRVTVTKTGAGVAEHEEPDPAQYSCGLAGAPNIVYLLAADSMGRGSVHLGWALMQTFVKTIIEMNPLPRTIICYNAGVRLVCEESKVLEALRELERRGVEILVCGTCLDYFEILGQLKVGKLSNMLEIMSSLHNADRVVSPM